MALPIARVGAPLRRTTTGAISTGACQLLGFYVANTNAGTLVISDGSNAISGTITPAIGFHEFPAIIQTSATATIGGTALDVTFFFAG